jgi:hypothetical protein
MHWAGQGELEAGASFDMFVQQSGTGISELCHIVAVRLFVFEFFV